MSPKSHIDERRPWPGLEAFTESQSRYFFGRRAEQVDLLRRILRETTTVIFGESGLGKTSLLQAGLFSRLRDNAFLPVLVRLDHGFGAGPLFDQVKNSMRQAFASAELLEETPFAPNEPIWEYLHERELQIVDRVGRPVTPVIVFDQFEEVFTLGSSYNSTKIYEFFDELSDLIENRVPATLTKRLEVDEDLLDRLDFDRKKYRILISLREDYLAPLLAELGARAPSLVRNRFRLTRMTREQAFEAVSEPGKGLVSEDVVREIIKFLGASPSLHRGDGPSNDELLEIEPALLSLFCYELNERRLNRRWPQITSELVVGNKESILESFYERAMKDVPPELRAFVEDTLVTKSGNRIDVPRELAEEYLTDKGISVGCLDELVSRRLLQVKEGRVPRIELIHDVLIDVVRRSRIARQEHQAAAEAVAREKLAAIEDAKREKQAAVRAAERATQQERELRIRSAERQLLLTRVGLGVAVCAVVFILVLAVKASREAAAARAFLPDALNAAREKVEQIREAFESGFMPTGTAKKDLDAKKFVYSYGDVCKEQDNGNTAHQCLHLYDALSEAYLILGDVKAALLFAQSQNKIAAYLAKQNTDNEEPNYDLARSFQRIGDAKVELGELSGASAAFMEVLHAALRFRQSSDERWQRVLADVHEKIGDVFQAENQLEWALDQYRAKLDIANKMRSREDRSNKAADSSYWQWQEAKSRLNIGDVLRAQEKIAEAREQFSKFEKIVTDLVERDPSNARWQWLLSLCHERLGDIEMHDRDFDRALDRYHKFLEIAEQLTLRDPSNSNWQRGRAIAHERIGDSLMALKKPAEALGEYQEDGNIARGLARTDQANTTFKRDLAIVEEKIGDVQEAQNAAEAALEHYREYQKIAKELNDKDHRNAYWGRDLAVSQQRIGDILDQNGDPSGAYRQFERCQGFQSEVKVDDPRNSWPPAYYDPNRDWSENVQQYCLQRAAELKTKISLLPSRRD